MIIFCIESIYPIRRARSKVADHYYHRPRRFFGLKSGVLLKLVRKFSGSSGRGYRSEESFKIKFRNPNFENAVDIEFFYFLF